MKKREFYFGNISWNKAEQELQGFKALLQTKNELDEKKDIQKYLYKKHNLSFLIGLSFSMSTPTAVAYDSPLSGDLITDIFLFDSKSCDIVLIELENARRTSLFIKKQGRSLKYWSNRLEIGFGQTIDWLAEADFTKAKLCQNLNLPRIRRVSSVLVIGRSVLMTQSDQLRFEHRRDTIQSSSVNALHMLDYDSLVVNLDFEIARHKAGNQPYRGFKKQII
jgi:hypothetical protein